MNTDSSSHEESEGRGSSSTAPPGSLGADDERSSAPDVGTSFSLASDLATQWVKTHQKATLLGSFAAGVFIGAMFRD